MDLPFTIEDIMYAENFLAQGDIANAQPMLLDMRDDAEAYIAEECPTEEDKQYFCFADTFERLAYRRVEQDPRELVQVELPFDRVYSDLAFTYIVQQEYALARDALMQAVRWDPMNCNYRLDLAELFRALGDTQEWASLSVSVIERSADAHATARAYANLGQFFLDEDNLAAAVGCARFAMVKGGGEQRVVHFMNRLSREHPDWNDISEDQGNAELMLQGVPTGPSAEIAICLLMCASDAGAAGDRDAATNYIVRARDLIGEAASKALIKLIHESDAELAEEKAAQALKDMTEGGAEDGAEGPAADGAESTGDGAPDKESDDARS